MSDLLTFTRKHDLPPKWDGRRVEWSAFEWSHDAMGGGQVFICPPPAEPDACSACGGTKPTITATGTVHPLPGDGHDWPVKQLVVWRCMDCRHDVVYDMARGATYDLDETDYGDDGSHEPVPEHERLEEPALACTVCGVVDEHDTRDCPTRPAPTPRPRPARRPAGTTRTVTRRAPRARHDGSCTACDDLHPLGAPCGRPAPPPPGWRPNLKGTH